MAIDFSSVKDIQIPVNGTNRYVKKIENSSGVVLWKKAASVVNVYVYAQREKEYYTGNLHLENVGNDISLYTIYNEFFDNGNYIDNNEYSTSKFYIAGAQAGSSETTVKSRGDTGTFSTPNGFSGSLTWNSYSPSSATTPNVATSFNPASGKLYTATTKFSSKVNPNTTRPFTSTEMYPVKRIGIPRVCMWNDEAAQKFVMRIEDMGYAEEVWIITKNMIKDSYSNSFSANSAGTYYFNQNQTLITGKKYYLKFKIYREEGNTDFIWELNSIGVNGQMHAHTYEDYQTGDVMLQGAKVIVSCREFKSPSIEKSRLKLYTSSVPYYICD